jgi:hypothetical protein
VLGGRSPNSPGSDRRHAISNDGSRVLWSEEGQAPHLYLRDIGKQETVEVDAVQGGSGTGDEPKAQFQTASRDGSKVFFTDTEALTADSTAVPGAPDLYEFEVGAGEKLGGTLTDITVDSNTGEAADVRGTLPGAGEDGSDVYLVAQGRLTGEPRTGCLAELNSVELAEEAATQEGRCRAKKGADNLYVHEPDPSQPGRSVIAFVASLSGEDQNDWNGDMLGLTSRVSLNGRYLAFMSERSLTGYDNVDANGDVPDEEVYLYDATSGRLACASCNPTGARPVGVHDLPGDFRRPIYDPQGFWNGRWLGASVPGWTGFDLETSLYQSRYLSNSGRLFFNSSDALVPQDTNEELDVYEYEPAGIGSCQTASVTFSARSGGCVGPVSSGASGEESVFVDASEDGSDVFFLTSAQLASQDIDSAYDMYDAHACSVTAPCPPAAVAPPACTTADSCRAAPASQPGIFGAPASATFSGKGNPTPPAVTKTTTATKPKAKPLTRAQKLTRALKACRSKSRQRRSACEIRARKLYGARRGKRSFAKAHGKAKPSSRRGNR